MARLCRAAGLLGVEFKNCSRRANTMGKIDGLCDASDFGKARKVARSDDVGSTKAATAVTESLQDKTAATKRRRTATDSIPSGDDAPGGSARRGPMEGASTPTIFRGRLIPQIADHSQVEEAHAAQRGSRAPGAPG